jgi:hypothetical protein
VVNIYRNLYQVTGRYVAEDGEHFVKDVLERGAEKYISAKRRGSKWRLEKIA